LYWPDAASFTTGLGATRDFTTDCQTVRQPAGRVAYAIML